MRPRLKIFFNPSRCAIWAGCALWWVSGWLPSAAADSSRATNSPASIYEPGQPLSLADALNHALQHSPAVRRAQKDLEASQGVSLQTRAVALPKVQIIGDYTAREPDSVDQPPAAIPGFTFGSDQSWSSQIRLVQSIYEGGRLVASVRSARLIRDRAMLGYQAAVADAVLSVHLAYFDVLLTEKQIAVREAALELLTSELTDNQNRFAAGTVPRFNVLRAEVELANARPPLVRARNSLRIARNQLANVIGMKFAPDAPEDLPLVLTDVLQAEPLNIDLRTALQQAALQRSEIGARRKTQALRMQDLVNARSGYKPRLQVFGGYESRSSIFSRDLEDEVHGWLTGVQLNWNLFDSLSTQGKVAEASALADKAAVELDETSLQIELEVRTAFSRFVEATELLASQSKVIEQAEESLRLARARSAAGTGTQLDVLGAQTALTEARTQHNASLYDYAVARARLQRAVGNNVPRIPMAD